MNSTSNTDTIRRAIAPTVEECTSRFNLGPKCNLLMDMMESLEELLKQTWTIWGVSCLFGFQSDELQLKLYAKRLREEVAAILPHDNATYNASFAITESIVTRPRHDDYPPLKIELFSQTTNEKSKERTIYSGVFISWRTTLNESRSDNTTKLPLLLCRGTKSAMNAVHTVVSQMFDCQIVPMSATEDELEWLVPMMLSSIDDEQKEYDKHQIRLEYRIPGLPATDTISVDFEISALSKLWNV
ncbi:uncharacterized protein [Venturia canescens]|nr:uncharacterized protein LOC122414057 isoform X2 [Venturia canescens]